MEKECATCVYYNTDRQDQPCCSCYDHINYEEMEEEENDIPVQSLL